MKKEHPLKVLEIIEPYISMKSEYFEAIQPNDFILKFIDQDQKSNFYFNVEQYKVENELLFLIDFAPTNELVITNSKKWIRGGMLYTYFTNWVKLLEGYEKVKTLFDDPIASAYADEYFTEFEIVDDDSEVKPFATKQILLLDEHLENIQTKIEEYQTQENKIEIEQIKNDIVELRDNLTKKSKKWVVKQLTKIWGKIAKQGPKLIKEFLSEVKTQVIKEGIKVFIEKGSNLLS
jgi:hypothetical protein